MSSPDRSVPNPSSTDSIPLSRDQLGAFIDYLAKRFPPVILNQKTLANLNDSLERAGSAHVVEWLRVEHKNMTR